VQSPKGVGVKGYGGGTTLTVPRSGAIVPKGGAMTKLSEAQKRVLTACWVTTGIWMNTWGGRWSISWSEDDTGEHFQPQRKTVEILEGLGLLRRDPPGLAINFEYHLTDKGREVAKELEEQDAETE